MATCQEFVAAVRHEEPAEAAPPPTVAPAGAHNLPLACPGIQGYFFNGGREEAFEREDRVLIPSDRRVTTYDLAPEMRAQEITTAAIEDIGDRAHDFIVMNYANADMVGHTGVIPAAVTAVETVDECLARVVSTVHAAGGACAITADHGNAEQMLEPDGGPSTFHSLNPVPVIVSVFHGRRASRYP